MNDRKHHMNSADAKLESHFQRLRRSEQASAPAIPDNARATQQAAKQQDAIASTVVKLPAPSQKIYRAAPKMAAAIAALAVGVGLLIQQPEEDPAVLYSNIMSGPVMQTDVFMQVSSSVLPALYEMPQLYDTDFTYDSNPLVN